MASEPPGTAGSRSSLSPSHRHHHHHSRQHRRSRWRRLVRRLGDRYPGLRPRNLLFYAVALGTSVLVAYGVSHCEMGVESREP